MLLPYKACVQVPCLQLYPLGKFSLSTLLGLSLSVSLCILFPLWLRVTFQVDLPIYETWAFSSSSSWLCHILYKVESYIAQSCPTPCNPMDCSLPEFSVYGIFQARVLEWVAISFSRESSQSRNRTQVSHIVGRHFTVWTTKGSPYSEYCHKILRGILHTALNMLISFSFLWLVLYLSSLNMIKNVGKYNVVIF